MRNLLSTIQRGAPNKDTELDMSDGRENEIDAEMLDYFMDIWWKHCFNLFCPTQKRGDWVELDKFQPLLLNSLLNSGWKWFLSWTSWSRIE